MSKILDVESGVRLWWVGGCEGVVLVVSETRAPHARGGRTDVQSSRSRAGGARQSGARGTHSP